MSFKNQLISKLPMPKQWKLELHRSFLSRTYRDEINIARKSKNKVKVQELKNEFRFAMDIHEEDEDEFHTKMLIRKSRRLRVQIPHRIDEAGDESEFWYQGHYTGGWYLTNIGTAELRKEIRSEIKGRSESRLAKVVWLTGITGTIGAISGLIAVISKLN